MQKGIKSRLIIHKILKDLWNSSKNLNESFENHTRNTNLIKSDVSLIHSVVLSSMRYYKYVEKIIFDNTKKIKEGSNSYFLLLSSITQILILDYKIFAVVNCTVEISKIPEFHTSSKFINGVLRSIIRKKIDINKIDIKFNELPKWFIKEVSQKTINEQKKFLQTIKETPGLHIVFNKKILIPDNLKKQLTTSQSIYHQKFLDLKSMNGYADGHWWVQDYSSMMPIYLSDELKNKNVADLCSAPGGKTFQLINNGCNVNAFDKNEKRLIVMKSNLQRLKFECNITKIDILNMDNKKKFDVVILDAPCSSIGTIRRNPEIFFRKKDINIDAISKMQYLFLKKSTTLLKKNGILIYMVCSFIEKEGEKQIFKLMKENKKVSILPFKGKDDEENNLINEEGFYHTFPKKIKENILIDGFFAAKMKINA